MSEKLGRFDGGPMETPAPAKTTSSPAPCAAISRSGRSTSALIHIFEAESPPSADAGHPGSGPLSVLKLIVPSLKLPCPSPTPARRGACCCLRLLAKVVSFPVCLGADRGLDHTIRYRRHRRRGIAKAARTHDVVVGGVEPGFASCPSNQVLYTSSPSPHGPDFFIAAPRVSKPGQRRSRRREPPLTP